jgi:hypothetical protein
MAETGQSGRLTATANGRMGAGPLREVPMRIRPTCAALAASAVLAMAAPAAQAFTVENQEAAGPYSVPKFDLEEQARQFRKESTDAKSTGKVEFESALGKGSLNFGVQQNTGSSLVPGLAPSPGWLGTGPSRRDFDRMLAPPNAR